LNAEYTATTITNSQKSRLKNRKKKTEKREMKQTSCEEYFLEFNREKNADDEENVLKTK